jgi:tetratricopeptide (TPR) repeat protein
MKTLRTLKLDCPNRLREPAAVLDCAGRAQRRQRFRAQSSQSDFENRFPARKRRRAPLAAAVQIFALATLVLGFQAPADETSSTVRSARDFYNAGTRLLAAKKYADAEAMFHSALDTQDERVQTQAEFNLGHTRFADGAEILQKGPDAQKISARGNAALAAGDQILHAGESALAENNLEKMISAYLDGKRMQHELRSTEKIVQAAIETYGKVLAKWQRAADDFRSAKELNSNNSRTDTINAKKAADQNKEIIEKQIAKLIDEMRRMQEMLGAMGKQKQDLGKLLGKLKGQIPAPNAPPGMAGEDGDSGDNGSGGEVQPDSLSGQEEGSARNGDQMQTPLSPEAAGQILDGLSIDGTRRLAMSDKQTSQPKDRKGRNW